MITLISLSQLTGQQYLTTLSEGLGHVEHATSTTCQPCQGKVAIAGYNEGSASSSTDDFVTLATLSSSLISNTFRFPSLTQVNDYSIHDDVIVRPIFDPSTGLCDGYILAFTAKLENPVITGIALVEQSHVIRLDPNLNVVWHKIPYNNSGFRTFTKDIEIDGSNGEILFYAQKSYGLGAVIAKIDPISGAVLLDNELTFTDVTNNAYPSDLLISSNSSYKYVLTGKTLYHTYVVFLQSNLVLERRNYYDIDADGSGDEQSLGIIEADDDFFVIGSRSDGPIGNTYQTGYVMRIQGVGPPQQRGNVLWTKEFAIPDTSTYFFDIDHISGTQQLIISGQGQYDRQTSIDAGKGKAFQLGLDYSGNVIWSKQYQDNASQQGRLKDIEIDNFNICGCGTIWDTPSATDRNMMVIRTDAVGGINGLCDTTIVYTEGPLSPIKTIAQISTSSPAASDYALTASYGTAGLASSDCQTIVPATITGTKWIDLDCDGTLNGTESGAPGWIIELRDALGNILQVTTTDASGNYAFDVYASGNYYLTEVNLPGYEQQTPAGGAPYYVYIQLGNTYTGYDFGNCPCDDLIGIPPPMFSSLPPHNNIYIYDFAVGNGFLFVSGCPDQTSSFGLYLFDNVAQDYILKASFPAPVYDIEYFDNRVFYGGNDPGFFVANQVVTTTSPAPTLLGIPSAFYATDLEPTPSAIYLGGSSGTTTNLYKVDVGTSAAIPTNFPSTADIFGIGYVDDTGTDKLGVIGPFGTNLTTSNDIALYTPATAGTPTFQPMGLGLSGLTPPAGELQPDIVQIGNEVHVGGTFDINVSPTMTEQGYGIYDLTSGWITGRGVTGINGVFDIDYYNNHLYMVGLFNTIAGQPISISAIYDGSSYAPLGSSFYRNVVYANGLEPDGQDKLICNVEFEEEYATCGGSNCGAYLPDTTLCPGEPFTFYPYLPFSSGTFSWTFGDGNTSTVLNPTHTYVNVGTYTVTFDYDDGMGCAGTVTATVQIVNDQSCDFIPDPNPWEKLYGNNEVNYPVKVKRTPFNEMLVLGNIEVSPGINRGTLSKFDASSGSLIWHFEMDDDIGFTDIEFSNTSREYIIVGATPGRLSGVDQDNLSAIIKVDDAGSTYTVSLDNTFSQLGREYYEEITRHKNPPLALNGHDYFIAGAINYSTSSPPPPSYIDLVTFGNININRAMNVGSRYQSISHSGDDEFQRGIFTLNNGTVVTVGNDAQNDGIVVGIDPVTGSQNFAYEVLDDIDYYHGIEVPLPDQIMVVGSQFSTNNAIVSIFSTSTNTLEASWTFDNLDRFEEVFMDNAGFYYATALCTDPALAGIPMVIKFNVIQHPPVVGNHTLYVDWIKYIIDDDTLHTRPHIYVDDQTNFIYYADSRVDNPASFGQRDQLVAIFDLNMTSSDCIMSYTDVPINHTAPINLITPAISNINFGNVMGPNPNSPLDYLCADICIPPCILDWTWSQNSCYDVSFMALPSGVAPFTYNWDIDNDGIPDYTTANPVHDYGGPGTYTVCLGVTDAAGDYCEECKTITVTPDTEKPVINCPTNINLSVPACSRGSVATWGPITATDCGDPSTVSIVCSHASGDFFPCGSTKVTCIATDDEGMQDSCSFFVIINCPCSYMTNNSLTCDTLQDHYVFSVDLVNQSASGMTCQPPVITASIPSQYTVTINSMTQNANGDYYIEGKFFTQFCPNPSGFGINASMTCTCPYGLPVTCNTSTFFPMICCDSIYVAPQSVCSSKDTGTVKLSFWNTIKDISRTNWYVQDAPCPTTRFGGTPFKSDLGYKDLTFNPSLFTGADLCIYAEIILGGDEKPCDTLWSEVQTITMCDDVSCSMTPNQVYCQLDGSIGILPSPITLTTNIPECDYTIEWYDPLGNLIPGMTDQLVYQPPILSLPSGATCGNDYTYSTVMTGPCGPITCSSTIRLDNDNSPDGTISVYDPIDLVADSICDGDRLQITYQPECVDPSGIWSWETRNLDPISPWQALPGGSTIQTTYNSNSISSPHAYRIIKQNGVCPPDTITKEVWIRSPKTYMCSATPLDSCRTTGVELVAGLTPCTPGPDCTCEYEVNWYKDNVLIYSALETVSPSLFQYIDPSLGGDYSGIYTVEIIDQCCSGEIFTKTTTILPPPSLDISGPCYICTSNTVVTMTGKVTNPPNITPFYSWEEITPSGPVPIPFATSRQLTVIGGGTYRLTAHYPGGCTLTQDITVTDCSNSIAALRVINQTGSIAFNSQQYGLVLQAPSGAYFRMIWQSSTGSISTVPYSYMPGQPNTISIQDADLIISDVGEGMLIKDHDGNGGMPKIRPNMGMLISELNYPMVIGAYSEDADLIITDEQYGVIMADLNGDLYRLKVDDNGTLYLEQTLD